MLDLPTYQRMFNPRLRTLKYLAIELHVLLSPELLGPIGKDDALEAKLSELHLKVTKVRRILDETKEL